jgi:hypothetical protein
MSAVKSSPGFLEQAFTRISHKHFKKQLLSPSQQKLWLHLPKTSLLFFSIPSN